MLKLTTLMKKPIPIHGWLRECAGILILLGIIGTGHSQTAIGVPQALVIRNSGSVRVVGKDGVARSAYAGPIDASKPVTPSTQKNKVTDPAPVEEPRPMAAHVFAGETVTLGKDGFADLALAGAGVVRMQPESKIKLPEQGIEKPAETSLELLKGQLFINVDAALIKKQDNREFRLKTPTTILAVKGTRFFADSSASGDVIGVHQGEVSVTENVSKQTQLIGAGKATDANPGSPPSVRALNAQEQASNGVYAELELKRVPNTRGDMSYADYSNPSYTLADQFNFFWQCAAKDTRGGSGTIRMDLMPNNIGLEAKKCWILPLGKSQKGASVAGFVTYFSTSFDLNTGKEQQITGHPKPLPVVVEFSVTAAHIKAFRVFASTAETTERDLWDKGHGIRAKTVKVSAQPFWKVGKGDPVQLLPADQGVLVAVAGKDTWTRIQLAWNEIKGKGGIAFFVTYPGNPEYADDAQRLEFSIRDIEVLYRQVK